MDLPTGFHGISIGNGRRWSGDAQKKVNRGNLTI